MIKRLWFQLGGAGGGGVWGGAFNESLGRGVPPSPSNPNLVSDKKLFISPPFLRQETLFHDPDSFRFAHEIMFL